MLRPLERVGKEEAMDAREATVRQVRGDDAITTKIGTVALPLGSTRLECVCKIIATLGSPRA
jgi:hypothetical protein